MSQVRFSVGDDVLASREESGENHEPGKVVDSYELIMGEKRRPVVVVEFEDGERKYLTAAPPNVLAVESEDEEEPADDGQDDRAVEADPEPEEPAAAEGA